MLGFENKYKHDFKIKDAFKNVKCPHCGSSNKYWFCLNQEKTKVGWNEAIINVTMGCNKCYHLYRIDLECNIEDATVGENNGKV